MSIDLPRPVYPPIVNSDSVVLRRLQPKDAKTFHAYRANPSVAEFQFWPKMTDADSDGFFAHMAQLETVLRPDEWTQIGLAHPKTDRLLGDMGWFMAKDMRSVELGITIDPRHQRKGYAFAAMSVSIGYIFQQTNVERIVCGADPRNTGSLALIRKLGFTWTHHDPSPTEPDIMDEMFAMTRTENLLR